MTDPRHGDATAADALSDVERDARVEQLLVSGLDEYFAGRHDQAINVWTRVLFLDRSNDRARAYIDRARRAQAERQRETEALMHEGLQAFEAGDVDRARRLLTAAVERGAPHEQALPVLHRIGLLEPAGVDGGGAASASDRRRQGIDAPNGRDASARFGPVLVMATAVAVAALVLLRADAGPEPGAPVTNFAARPESLPVPGPSEAYLARARAFFQTGKLPDALAALDHVEPGDPQFREAQALRGRVQRALLAAAAAPAAAEEPVP